MTATFQWLKGHYSLRGEISSAAGKRFDVARIILNAEPGRLAIFDEDHHSYRLRDLIQRNGGRGGMLPDGKLGRQEAIDRCSESYAAYRPEHHVDLSPDEYRTLLADLLTTATIFHGQDMT